MPQETDFESKKIIGLKALIQGQKQQSFEFYIFDYLDKIISLEKDEGINNQEISSMEKYKKEISPLITTDIIDFQKMWNMAF